VNSGTTSAAIFDFTIPEGAQGAKGDQGDQGLPGDPGAPGSAATVDAGTTTTVPFGDPATVTNSGTTSAAIFDFEIPQGEQGVPGDPGDPGAPGAAATADAGTTTTLAPGSPATVVNSGSTSAAVFDFGIPEGLKGDQGDPGDPGTPGAAATIAAGTATSVPYGDPPTVTNSGSSSAAIFDFEIPEGPQGDPGPPGAGGANGYYGSFYDTTDQPILVANTAQVVTINSTYGSLGVSIVAGSQITFANPGTYNLTFVAQVSNIANSQESATFWLRFNGSDYPNSATVVSLQPRKNVTTPSTQLVTVSVTGTATVAGQYVELWWLGSSTDISLAEGPASVAPPYPEQPSMIVSVLPVMFTQLGPAGPAGPGVPTGGSAGQFLSKIDGTDYNTQWVGLAASDVASGVFATARTGATVGVPSARIAGGNVIASPLISGATTGTTVAVALGAMYLTSAIRSGAVPTLGFHVSATNLTAGQGVFVVNYLRDEATDLPSTLNWAQFVTVGTGTGGTFVTGTALTVPPGSFLGILNPSTNSGTVTLQAAQPTVGPMVLMTLTNRFALIALSQGATAPADVSAYTLSSGGGATTFAPSQTCPWVLGRVS
jgi:hypothetical protein